jgi:hypothetical protein
MAGHDRKKQVRSANVGRRLLVGMGAGAGVFFAAAAMATGSAAPAKADFEDLLDPIIQPLLTSVTDSLAGFDPAAAADLTSWTDSLLASLNSIDVAAPAASESAVAAAASPAADPTEADPTTGTYDIPITVQEDTEPTVQAAIGSGPDQTLLVDTGSSGLVVPYTDLGSNFFTQLENLYDLGFPTGISESGYSGGVQYIYLEYNDATVDYGDGALTTTNTPIDVEVLSWSDSDVAGAPANFQDFLTDNDSTGILGIGDSSTDTGPTESPLQADGYDGVTVDIPNVPTSLDEPDGDLIVDPSNPGTAIATLDGAPTPSTELTETVTDGGTTVGTGSVFDDFDSGGVYGTIPTSIASTDLVGDKITVYDGSTPLYSYTVGTDTPDGTDQTPEEESGIGTSQDEPIDSGIEAFLGHEVYIDYANDTLGYDS